MAMDLGSGASRESRRSGTLRPTGILLTADGKSIYTTAQELGQDPLFSGRHREPAKSPSIIKDGSVSAIDLKGPTLVYTRNSLQSGDQLVRRAARRQRRRARSRRARAKCCPT
jgi:hypothetical protein